VEEALASQKKVHDAERAADLAQFAAFKQTVRASVEHVSARREQQ
jgi:hypothetical protein